jgi:hypothetical protein
MKLIDVDSKETLEDFLTLKKGVDLKKGSVPFYSICAEGF